jgi:hypothetical protein
MYGAWEAFAWDADDNKGYITNDDYPDKDVSKTYPVSPRLSYCKESHPWSSAV